MLPRDSRRTMSWVRLGADRTLTSVGEPTQDPERCSQGAAARLLEVACISGVFHTRSACVAAQANNCLRAKLRC